MNLRDPWFGFVRIVRISKLLTSYWSKNLAKGWKHTFWIIKMQIFPKTKKKSLFSIKTRFALLEKKIKFRILGFRKTRFLEKIETPGTRATRVQVQYTYICTANSYCAFLQLPRCSATRMCSLCTICSRTLQCMCCGAQSSLIANTHFAWGQCPDKIFHYII